MWGLPGPGLEPMSPALAGGFLTTMPPGKSLPGHFGFLGPIHQQVKRVTIRAGIIDPDQQDHETGLLILCLYMRAGQSNVQIR